MKQFSMPDRKQVMYTGKICSLGLVVAVGIWTGLAALSYAILFGLRVLNG